MPVKKHKAQRSKVKKLMDTSKGKKKKTTAGLTVAQKRNFIIRIEFIQTKLYPCDHSRYPIQRHHYLLQDHWTILNYSASPNRVRYYKDCLGDLTCKLQCKHILGLAL